MTILIENPRSNPYLSEFLQSIKHFFPQKRQKKHKISTQPRFT